MNQSKLAEEKFDSPASEITLLLPSNLRLICLFDGCVRTFETEDQRKEHFFGEHLANHFCKQCNRQFPSRKAINDHYRKCHRKGKFPCPVDGCEFEGKYRNDLKRHKNHAHRESLKCTYEGCNAVYTQKYNLSKHIEFAHLKLKKFTCTWPKCGMSFSYKQTLQRHIRIHKGLKRFKCKWPKCSYAYAGKFGVLTHIRTMHLKLPKTRRKQREQNIPDESYDKAYEYLEILPEEEVALSGETILSRKRKKTEEESIVLTSDEECDSDEGTDCPRRIPRSVMKRKAKSKNGKKSNTRGTSLKSASKVEIIDESSELDGDSLDSFSELTSDEEFVVSNEKTTADSSKSVRQSARLAGNDSAGSSRQNHSGGEITEQSTDGRPSDIESESSGISKPNSNAEKRRQCTYEGCGKSFDLTSGFQKHIQRAHLDERNPNCSRSGCGMTSKQRPRSPLSGQFKCKWPHCSYGPSLKCVILTHIRIVHLKLPKKRKQLKEKNIPHELYNKAYEYLEEFSTSNSLKSEITSLAGEKASPNSTIPASVAQIRSATSVMKKKSTKQTIRKSKRQAKAMEKREEEEDDYSSYLVKHYEKGFHCTYEGCAKTFYLMSSLKKHIQLAHLKEKNPLCCCKWPHCSYGPSLKCLILNHIRIMHLQLPQSRKQLKRKTIPRELYDKAYEYIEELSTSDSLESTSLAAERASKEEEESNSSVEVITNFRLAKNDPPASSVQNTSGAELAEHSTTGLSWCLSENCDQTFTTEKNIRKTHLDDEHLENYFCQQCNRQFFDREAVGKHFMETHLDVSLSTSLETVVTIPTPTVHISHPPIVTGTQDAHLPGEQPQRLTHTKAIDNCKSVESSLSKESTRESGESIQSTFREADQKGNFLCPVSGCGYRLKYRRDLEQHKQKAHTNLLTSTCTPSLAISLVTPTSVKSVTSVRTPTGYAHHHPLIAIFQTPNGTENINLSGLIKLTSCSELTLKTGQPEESEHRKNQIPCRF